MDKNTLLDILDVMGGRLYAKGDHTILSGLAAKDQLIIDHLVDDLDALELDDKIDKAIDDRNIPDEELQSMLKRSPSWAAIKASPTPDSKEDPFLTFAKFIENNLCEHPGACLLEGITGGWELWIKTGPDMR